MADRDEQDVGPKLVWTFPLATRMQQRTRVFGIGDNILSMIGSSESTSDDDGEDFSSYGGGDNVDDLEQEIDSMEEASDDVFGDTDYGYGDDADFAQSDGETEVVIEQNVATPTIVEIDKGEKVTWVNRDDTTRRLTSVQGESFDSGQLTQDDVYTHEFMSDEAVVYVDTIAGGDELSGAVLVGDADKPESLPSESSVTPVPLGNGDDFGSPESLSDVAENDAGMEPNMGTGFN